MRHQYQNRFLDVNKLPSSLELLYELISVFLNALIFAFGIFTSYFDSLSWQQFIQFFVLMKFTVMLISLLLAIAMQRFNILLIAFLLAFGSIASVYIIKMIELTTTLQSGA
jgi:hypothetical protein